jgi:hypothetical protein
MIYQMQGGPLDGGEVSTPEIPIGADYNVPVVSVPDFNPCDLGQEMHLVERKVAVYRVHRLAEMEFIRFQTR